MKVEIQSGGSSGNSLTDRLRSRTQNETHQHEILLGARTKNTLERSQSLLQCCSNIANLRDWFSVGPGSHCDGMWKTERTKTSVANCSVGRDECETE